MRMKPEHRKHIADAVAPWDTPFHRERYAAAGHSDKRYRWDCLWAAKLSAWVCSTLYPYLNDEHIDTALRSLIKPLDRTQP